MKKERESLIRYLQRRFDAELVFKQEKYTEFSDYVNEHHNLEMSRISDAVTGRSSLDDYTDFELFCFLQGLIYLNLAPQYEMDRYFTETEIKEYDRYKLETKDLDVFPLKIKAVEITYNQWIGRISVKELMDLREKHLINYNINAQRSMQRVIKGDREFYKITLNKTAVRKIRDMYESGDFIPNTITLNIPNSPDSVFNYDAKNMELIIDHVDHFDISDGYHRYIAACQAYDNNNDFDYPMEIRIVSFEDDKIKKFIFQEDQKTKMSKVNSESMDTSKISNVVTERLATNMVSDLKDIIRRDSSNYNFSQVSYLIDYYFGRDMKRLSATEKAKATHLLASKLMNDFNALLDTYPEYLDKGTWGNVAIMLYGFRHYDEDPRNMIKKIKQVLDSGATEDIKPSKNGLMRIKTSNEIENLYKDS